MTLIFLQVVVPLALLAWLGLAPLRSRGAIIVQGLGTALLLLALHLGGLWLTPPWWTPWLYWILFCLALYRAWRHPPAAARPATLWGWGAVVLLAALGVYAGSIAVQAYHGREPPRAAMVNLAFPLQPGAYYVANGGSNASVSSHAVTLARATPRQRHFYGQSYAVDLVAIDRFGFQAAGLNPSDPRRYRIFGAHILAPCVGRVAIAVDGKPDLRVPVMDSTNIAGNHVLLRCGRADVLLAHMRRGSVRVRAGDKVGLGQTVGEVGNSGNSSVPHLHVHAQRPGTAQAPLSGAPLTMRIDGQYLVRGDRPSRSVR